MMSTRWLRILAVLLALAGCSHPQTYPLQSKQAASGDWTLPYGKGSFSFITPWQLPAYVTQARVIDTDGYLYTFYTLDSTSRDPVSIDKWGDILYSGSVNFNKINKPPQFIVFCWDSLIDRRTYETRVIFSPAMWQRMKTPADHLFGGEPLWYNNILFGLAPGGKVRIWFPDVGDYPAIPVTPRKIHTLSGNELTICKEGANSDFLREYRYSSDTEAFIKGKTYPYGEW
ncbi:DUF2931 family protein [Citrobacter koseri]|uniref:DUF2931 family protein n=1 Tax=Citrobacter koseri TaxID=545 RepID=UPI0019082986|nr:DUF2931 family protein [Citrobacter koseri]MBJ8868412.1 DUF2931 family protein [Citrobacter koseri]MBL4564279.1 DUF2931 family protein [Citrobacter koseri]